APRAKRTTKSMPTFTRDFRDLKRGDHVVHADHGIGRFDGTQLMGEGDSAREFMVLIYKDGNKLFVPLDRLDLVERYSGVGGLSVRLDRLGGGTWEKVKRSVKKSMVDMTKELLDLAAARAAAKGFQFSEDGDWQHEFEGAFPFEETPDQAGAIDDVKADMCAVKPMDRLVVGDVGFGKTEVALRAAFKAVMDGKQVAVLSPTTVLAFQHHATFSRRTAAWPVKVELLSRFRSKEQVKVTLERLEKGECDIAVGTHRLLSKDVKFKDLGLLIVDEEQRFGVRHKERIKQLRKEVDILTLTATPIPRTLSMAMGGLKDMSVIETAPANRHAIETAVLPFSPEVVQSAVRQELDRGGQVFFVHDRVESLPAMADLLRRLVPGCRIGMAHGQLPEDALERVMVDFLRGELDVLASTTVIENGLDIPRANTIIINRADRHGLAQLYQLRGRVGRSDRQAHAYFFVPGKSELTAEARRRLAALQEFTELGSGFRIAALDLEIRGAGNLLGGQQHGHVAALGLDTYVRLLEETVAELKGEQPEAGFRASLTLPIDLRLPADYVPDEAQRLTLYKRFATVDDGDAVLDLEQEVRDRHGPAPGALKRLVEHARLRLRAEEARIRSIECDGVRFKLEFASETRVKPQSLMGLLQERPEAAFSPGGVLTVPIPEEAAGPVPALWELLRRLD
ncbi:MAG: transcription-repair coupling factor, partial [Acidobacteriota bacterium]